MKKTIVAAVLGVLLSVPAFAQTASWPYTTTNKLVWVSPGQNGTPAQAQTLVPRLYVDGSSSFTAVSGATCANVVSGGATVVECSATLTTALVAIFNAWIRGNHTLELSLFDGVTDSGKSAPFTSTVPTAVPTGFSIR